MAVINELRARAQTFWTPERTEKITGAKKLLITPREAPELLRTMGLLNADASMSADSVRKYRQINHMLALLTKDLETLAKQFATVRFIDIGCGNSYLTFLVAWFFKEKLRHPFEGVGADSNARVIAESQKRAQELGFQNQLRFVQSSVADVQWEAPTRPHFLIALHACDTATDQALAFAVRHKCDFVAVAPCCQAELAQAWKERTKVVTPFAPVFRSHHFRREIAADITDVMRMLLMRSHGYEVTATEFVGTEHTPKNRLLVCTRRGAYLDSAKAEFEQLKEAFAGSSISLEHLLASALNEHERDETQGTENAGDK